jgi:hypothetical protein
MDGHSVLASLQADFALTLGSSSSNHVTDTASSHARCPGVSTVVDPLARSFSESPPRPSSSSHVVSPMVEEPGISASSCCAVVDSKCASGTAVASATKRPYRPNRPIRKGPHKPHKPHTGKKDGKAAIRKRAARLLKRIGLRTARLTQGGGLPKVHRKAARRDAVHKLVGPEPGGTSLKPLSSSAAPDLAWKAGVERLMSRF